MVSDEELDRQVKGALAEAIAQGHVEIMGYDEEGAPFYRLTPAGIADVERRFGLKSKAEEEGRHAVYIPSQSEASDEVDLSHFEATEDLTLEGRAAERAAEILRRRGKAEDKEPE